MVISFIIWYKTNAQNMNSDSEVEKQLRMDLETSHNDIPQQPTQSQSKEYVFGPALSTLIACVVFQPENSSDGNEAPVAPDSSGEDEPEQLSIYDLLAGAGDEITDDGDGVLLRQPNFNILQIGNPDFVRYDRLSGGETLHPVCPLEESEKWWDEQVSAAKEMGTCSTAP